MGMPTNSGQIGQPQMGFGMPASGDYGQNPQQGFGMDPNTGLPFGSQPPDINSFNTSPVNTLAPGGGGMDYNGNAIGSNFGGQFNFGGQPQGFQLGFGFNPNTGGPLGGQPQGPQLGFGFNPNTGGPLGGPGIMPMQTSPMQTQALTAPGPMQNLKPGPGMFTTAGAAGMPVNPRAQMQSVNGRPGTQMSANNVQRQQNNVFGNNRGQTAYGSPNALKPMLRGRTR